MHTKIFETHNKICGRIPCEDREQEYRRYKLILVFYNTLILNWHGIEKWDIVTK